MIQMDGFVDNMKVYLALTKSLYLTTPSANNPQKRNFRVAYYGVGGSRFFFDSANEHFGVVGCVQGCKTGLEAFL